MLNTGALEVPHARTCLSTATSCPCLGSTRHALNLPSVWQPRFAAAKRNGVLKICKTSTFFIHAHTQMHACTQFSIGAGL